MNDLISRQDAIDAVIKRDANCGVDSAEVLKALPSAQTERKPYHEEWISALRTQPEQKVGKWIPCDVDSRGMTNMFVCSKCGSFTSLPILRYANAMEYDFCPNCGADMRGEQDG